MGACLKILVVLALLTLGLYLFVTFTPNPEQFRPEEKWFGPGVRPKKMDDSIRPFKISVPEGKIKDLKARLKRDLEENRLANPPIAKGFGYGFSQAYLKEVITYWKDKFDWKKTVEEKINKDFPQFMTNIDGVEVHFLHIKPKKPAKTIVPLLLVHGWPGSFLEFTKLIPLLTEGGGDLGIEIVAPSIPGYGFSSAAAKEGLDAPYTAKMFVDLMERLGHNTFYTQGGDWGGIITFALSALWPERVRGYHTSNAFGSTLGEALKSLIVSYMPWLFMPPEEEFMVHDVGKIYKEMMVESGYLHEQATKPDTIGVALDTSPTGLAAWILEKFSTLSGKDNHEKDDGGLTEKFTMDELVKFLYDIRICSSNL